MKAISIPEKNEDSIKHKIIILMAMDYFLGLLLSNFLANFLLKKNIKTANPAMIKLNQGVSLSVFNFVNPS
jgi:hypothetical protein